MTTVLKQAAAGVAVTLLALAVTTTALAQDCAPGVNELLVTAPYQGLLATLQPNGDDLTAAVQAMLLAPTVGEKETAYNAMVSQIETVLFPGLGASPRLLLTESDGTVIYDSAQIGKTVTNDDANCGITGDVPRNSYPAFCTKQVNENHNSRVAILATQLFPCGLGVETKFSTSVNKIQSYVAVRMGDYLNSMGTARYSADQ
jgi:hypothetical protein